MTVPLTSTVPTVKAALIAALAGRDGLDGVTVLYAWDGVTLPPEGRQEWIFLDPPEGQEITQSSNPVLRGSSRLVREETYDIVVVIRVDSDTDQTAVDVEARTFELFAEVENMFADSIVLGGVVGQAGSIRVGQFTRQPPFMENQRWRCQIVARLAVKTRLH